MELRHYDPAIARWVAIDPVTHHSMSPYNAFDNNPVFWADPSGADSQTVDEWAEGVKEDWAAIDRGASIHDESGSGQGTNSDENCTDCKTLEDYYNYYSAYFKSPVVQERAKEGLKDTGIGALKGLLSSFRTTSGKQLIETTGVTKSQKFGFTASIILFALLEPGPGGESKLVTNVFDLVPTQSIRRSKNEFKDLVSLIKKDGITEPIEYAVKNGEKYIQNGHHRAYIAKRLGIKNVPTKEIPYKAGMEFYEPGKNPGYLKHIKY